MQAAVLAMLGLLLGFTVSMAVDRYERRRALVLEEANAIGTTWLRASLLPEPHRQPVRDLLQNYLDIRLRTEAQMRDPVLVAEGLGQAREIQSKLWQQAEASAKEAPDDITATFVESCSNVRKGKRRDAGTHAPVRRRGRRAAIHERLQPARGLWPACGYFHVTSMPKSA